MFDQKFILLKRYLKYGDGTETDKNENHKVYYHRIGEAQEKDVLAIENPNPPTTMM